MTYFYSNVFNKEKISYFNNLEVKRLDCEMKNIVEDFVKYYKTDLEIDFKILCDVDRKADSFIFLTRNAGTHLFTLNHLYVDDAFERISFLYNECEFNSAHYINVKKINGSEIYGTIKKLDLDVLIKDVKKNKMSYEKFDVELTTVEQQKLLCTFSREDTYYQSLSKNGLEYNDIKKYQIIKYY